MPDASGSSPLYRPEAVAARRDVWLGRPRLLQPIPIWIATAASLVAIVLVTGVSGSGKSSLTMDTLYAEGQRRYAESLSAYARQFLMRMNKPDVDYIKGICPAIAIEQKVITRTPRSTVGSMTELYDYLRLLYARDR